MTSFIEEHKMTLTDEFSTIIGNSVDELVKNGVYHILTTGEKSLPGLGAHFRHMA